MTDTSRKGTMRIETQPCIGCGKTGVIEVTIDGYQRWKGGALIQNAFPTLDADQRELLVTGTHAHCWERMMGDEE